MKVSQFTVFLLSIALLSCNRPKTHVSIKNGVLDLREYDGHKEGPIKLNGEWMFSWMSFVTNNYEFKPNVLINVPGTWSYYSQSGLLGKNIGYCTYGLRILSPKTRQEFTLLLPTINSAYRLYINGKLSAATGKVSTDSQMVPSAEARLVQVPITGQETFISLQVSNYHFISGGIWAPILMGNPHDIEKYQFKKDFNSGFLIGGLLLIGIYHLCLFFLWKKNKSPLFFSMICFFIALRESFAGPAFFFLLFPEIPYQLALKILYLSFPVSILFFVLFFNDILNGFTLWIKTTLVSIFLVYIVIIIVTPNTFHGGLLPILSCVFAFTIVYLLFLSIKRYTLDPISSILVIAGILALIFCFLNDTLFESGVIQSYFLLPLGFLIFTLCQSVLLALRFSRIFRQSEDLAIELRKSEELKSIEEFKNRFFANITHEFRTPLMLVLSPVEELIKRGSLDKIVEKSLYTIHRNSTNLLRLINQLLDLAKADSGNMQVSFSKGNANDFFAFIIENFSHISSEKQIHLHYKCHQGDQELFLDWEKLEKISYNLLMNALKFTPPNGFVDLETSMNGTQFLMKVKDTGCGIPEMKKEEIFERFHQLENDNKYKTGTGIGLSLVKELVSIMKGSISVNSAPDTGSEFLISIPIGTPQDPFMGHWELPAQTLKTSVFKKNEQTIALNEEFETILLVEDNEELADFITGILRKHYNVLWEPNGELGWATCQNQLPGLVLSDIMMPEMDGVTMCKLIKETEETEHIGVILLTARSSTESKLEGLGSKANDYLTKPFNATELLLRIENFFAFRQAMKDHYRNELHTSPAPKKEQITNPFLLKIYTYIENNLDNSKLSIEDLSSEMAVSPRTLSRKLSALLGYSPNEVIRRYRLQKATTLLSSGYNISEIAYMVGFESASYFGQRFREVYKLTPSDYQRQ